MLPDSSRLVSPIDGAQLIPDLFHPFLGPALMVVYALLSNTLLLTVLVAILGNTFATINADAAAEVGQRLPESKSDLSPCLGKRCRRWKESKRVRDWDGTIRKESTS